MNRDLLQLRVDQTQEDIYQQALALAKLYCPDWTQYWPENFHARDDVGLVLLRLFAVLGEQTVQQINQIPAQRRLAFFRFLGSCLRAPNPAITPLIFKLLQNNTSTCVPAGTQVTHASNHQLIFQTQTDLQVLPATINVALSVLPHQGKFIDAGQAIQRQQPFAIFNSNAALSLPHYLLLGDNMLFANEQQGIQQVVIELQGSFLYPEYFSQWFDGNANLLSTTVQGDQGLFESLKITLHTLPQAPALAVDRVTANLLRQAAPDWAQDTQDIVAVRQVPDATYWVAVKPNDDIVISQAQNRLMPQLRQVTCYVTSKAIRPDLAARSGALVDVNNGVYPFSRNPRPEDAFYLAADQVFARRGAKVSLTFSLLPITVADLKVSLVWEFWQGHRWQALNSNMVEIDRYHFADTTNNLLATEPGPYTVSFVCPAMKKLTLAGQNKYWIRVRIAQGNYAKFEEKTILRTVTTNGKAQQSSLSYEREVYYPPFVQNVTLAYCYTQAPTQYLAHNNFHTGSFAITPYWPTKEQTTTFYLGFNRQGFAEHALGKTLALLFVLVENTGLQRGRSPNVEWQYYDGKSWRQLMITDDTHGLTFTGVVRMHLPVDMRSGNFFARHLFWLRLVNYSKQSAPMVLLQGIYPNAVQATNEMQFNNTVLGSGDTSPGQYFNLPHTPVLQDMSIGVLSARASTETADSLLPNTHSYDVNVAGERRRFIEWQQVSNFAFSKPDDCHYTVDYRTGRICFGDGVHGKTLPQGQDNVLARYYFTSNGLQGNCPAHSVTRLKNKLPHIGAVFNPVTAFGGNGGDDLSAVARLGPALVQSNERAVTKDDFNCLAMAYSPEVVRAQTLTDAQDKINVYILVDQTVKTPLPTRRFTSELQNYLQARALCSLQDSIAVLPPRYQAIDVSVQLQVNSSDTLQLKAQLLQQIQAFLHPVYGGAAGQGWPFGATISARSLLSWLRGLPAVTEVLTIFINGNSFGQVPLASDSLPCYGTIDVYLYTEESMHGV